MLDQKRLLNVISELHVNESSIKFANINFPSAKQIAIKDQRDNKYILKLINLEEHSSVDIPMNAENAVFCYHASRPVVAISAASAAQIVDVSSNVALNSFTSLPTPIKKWCFVDDDLFIILEDNRVMFWNKALDQGSSPLPVFNLVDTLSGGAQILNIIASPSRKFYAVSGLSNINNALVSTTQLYSAERKSSQPLPASAATFGIIEDTEVFAYVQDGIVRINPLAPGKYPKSEIQLPNNNLALFITLVDRYMQIYGRDGSITLIDVISKQIVSSEPNETALQAFSADNHAYVLFKDGSICSFTVSPEAIKTRALMAIQAGDWAGLAQIAQKDEAMRAFIFEQLEQAPSADDVPLVVRYLNELVKLNMTLNKKESYALVHFSIVVKNSHQAVTSLLSRNLITGSSELADLIVVSLPQEALKMYIAEKNHKKVFEWMVNNNATDKIVPYSQKNNVSPDFDELLITVLAKNPALAVDLGVKLVIGDVTDLDHIVDLFEARQHIKEASNLIYKVLQIKGATPITADYQTRLLSLNLRHNPQIADKLLSTNAFPYCDKKVISKLCLEAGLVSRAIAMAEDIQGVIAILEAKVNVDPESVVTWFRDHFEVQVKDALPELIIRVLNLLKLASPRAAARLADLLIDLKKITVEQAMKAFANNEETIIFFCSNRIADLDTDNAHLFAIACCHRGEMDALTRLITGNNNYDPNMLFEMIQDASGLAKNPAPILALMNKDEMLTKCISFLVHHNMLSVITNYVQKVNPGNTGKIVSALLSVDGDKEYIARLLESIKDIAPVTEICNILEKADRLYLMKLMLEARAKAGLVDPETSTALIKTRISCNETDNLTKILQEAEYDHYEVGTYCAERDPRMAFVAFATADSTQQEQCDPLLLKLSAEHALYKQLARYLVQRQSVQLWGLVLGNPELNITPVYPENHLNPLILQIKTTALPETQIKEQVNITVKAFIAADRPAELIELLEKIVFTNPAFSDNGYLQNILILTAIRANDIERVNHFINALDKYDAKDLASIAVASGMNEQALVIYKKFHLNVEAVGVLLTSDDDHWYEKSYEFAEEVNSPDVWCRIVDFLLDEAEPSADTVAKVCTCAIKARSTKRYDEIISMFNNYFHEDRILETVIAYCLMCRELYIKAPSVDSALCLSYALSSEDRQADLQAFINNPDPNFHRADLATVGKKVFDMGHITEAKLLLKAANAYPALTKLYLTTEEYDQAVNSAKQADDVVVWRSVFDTCYAAKAYSHAESAAIQVIIKKPSELDAICDTYQDNYKELIKMLEHASEHADAHMGIFTKLGELYVYHAPEKLYSHIRRHQTRINISRLILITRQQKMWPELVFLHKCYGDYEEAISLMMEYPGECFSHDDFIETLVEVTTPSVYYQAVDFYCVHQLHLLPEVLATIISVSSSLKNKNPVPVDHTIVVSTLEQFGGVDALCFAKDYIELACEQDKKVMKAYCKILLHLGEVDKLNKVLGLSALRPKPQRHLKGFVQVLAQNDLLIFREIGVKLCIANKMYIEAIDIAISNGFYKLAVQATLKSSDPALAGKVLQRFMSRNGGLVVALLFHCAHLIEPYKVLEASWRAGCGIDCIMPFVIDWVRRDFAKIDYTPEPEVDEEDDKIKAQQYGIVLRSTESQEDDRHENVFVEQEKHSSKVFKF